MLALSGVYDVTPLPAFRSGSTVDGSPIHRVAAGAPRSTGASLRSISLTPTAITANQVPFQSQVQVFAELDDGTKRDVTSVSVFTPSDETALVVKGPGLISVLRPGRHTLGS